MTRKFDFRQLLSVVSIGLVCGVIVLSAVISFAILIYSGELSSFATAGIGMVLFGGLIMQLIVALTSSVPGMIGAPQDSPAAILGLAALTITARMEGASLEAKFITVVIMVILTSVVSGLFFVFVGGFKLSRFIRFIPYPVVGGFVAGTGFLPVSVDWTRALGTNCRKQLYIGSAFAVDCTDLDETLIRGCQKAGPSMLQSSPKIIHYLSKEPA